MGADDPYHVPNLALARQGDGMSLLHIERRTPEHFTPTYKRKQLAAAVGASLVPAGIFLILAACNAFPLSTVAFVGLLLFSIVWRVPMREYGLCIGNQRLRESMRRDLEQTQPDLARRAIGFVGLSTATYLQTAHRSIETCEDVGFLCLTDGALIFRGDAIRLRIGRESILAVDLWDHPRLTGDLKKWVHVQYRDEGQGVDIYLASREQDRLSHRRKAHPQILAKINSWLHDPYYSGEDKGGW